MAHVFVISHFAALDRRDPPAEAVYTDAQGSIARPLFGPLDTLVAVIGSTAFCVV
jgi:hypothetical protein